MKKPGEKVNKIEFELIALHTEVKRYQLHTYMTEGQRKKTLKNNFQIIQANKEIK